MHGKTSRTKDHARWRDHLCTKSTHPQDGGTQSSPVLKHECSRTYERYSERLTLDPSDIEETAINFED
ncbi:hypothetical protein Q6247_25825, partial [Klebsiella pneumoniae]